MLFLDTNAFYYAAGISTTSINLPGLLKLISENETCISVVSLHEFLVKFRNDVGIIKTGLQFLADHHIKTAYNKFFPKPQNLEYINVDMSESELSTFVQSILQEKIDVESRFASIIFTSCFFSGAAFSAAKNIDSGMTNLATEVVWRAVTVVSTGNVDAFKQIFTDGYATDDCENYVRRAFQDLLGIYFQALIPICEAAKDTKDDITVDEFMGLHNWDDLSEQLSRRMARSDTTLGYLARIARAYWRESSDAHLVKYLRNFAKPICKAIPDAALQEYIVDIVERCCLQGGAFWKNDILDAFILCNLLEENKIVTFDKGAINHMEKHRADRKMYDESLKLIDTLL